jgi:hypothetical protein
MNQSFMLIDRDCLLELMAHQLKDVSGGANPRPYNGPKEVVALDATCDNGLAPNPFTHQCS